MREKTVTKVNINLIKAKTDDEIKAANIFSAEILKRAGKNLKFSDDGDVIFETDSSLSKDRYEIAVSDSDITFKASGIRGFIYAIGMFLRKTEYKNNEIVLIKNINGKYSPFMEVRGHQIGYRTVSNTYEAWTPEFYFDYVKELMYFGSNTFENTIVREEKNALMKFSRLDFARECSKAADYLGADVSFWYPYDDMPLEENVKEITEFFKEIPNAHIFFPPGGDPGELPAREFLKRTKAASREIKKIHPDIKVFPSAQSPHNYDSWGDEFIDEMEKRPGEIDGVITGPNAAIPLYDLRKRLPKEYPVRFYPDITHNIRCDYPVHYGKGDFHYSLASTLGREPVNPRPLEYETLHKITKNYVIGSVTYSEGINDDVNKAVWGNLDFFPNVSLKETIDDYARLFFYHSDVGKIADGIFGLSLNLEGDPILNPNIENTLNLFREASDKTPELLENYRFLALLFRAVCDAIVKKRRVMELSFIEDAKDELKSGNIDKAIDKLNLPYSEDYINLREEIEEIGKKLFNIAGMQLDVKRYFANNPERGAVLDTIDNPVTDRLWLLKKLEYSKTLNKSDRKKFIDGLINRNRVERDEFYFSFSENNIEELGIRQDEDYYMDFLGDRPNINDGSIPMSQLKIFDHYTFKMRTGGLFGKKYKLILHIKPRYSEKVTDFTIKINGKILYKGVQYGGERDLKWEKLYSSPLFERRIYEIPEGFIENGALDLEITEPKIGIMISEIFVLKNDRRRLADGD